MNIYQSVCKHENITLGTRLTTGENILGQTVTCKVEDFICKKCGKTDIKRVNEK